MKVCPESVIAVRLRATRSGRLASDAVIFANLLEMAPDGMEEVTTKIEVIPSGEPGLYRFKAKIKGKAVVEAGE